MEASDILAPDRILYPPYELGGNSFDVALAKFNRTIDAEVGRRYRIIELLEKITGHYNATTK